MPRGITDQFLKILEAEARRAWTVLALGVAAFVPALILADLADPPQFGSVATICLAVALLATAAAAALAYRAARKRTLALADEWSQWMKYSVASGTIDEIERKVHDRPLRPSWLAGFLVAAFLVANALVFALLWFEASAAAPMAAAMAAANGGAVGVLVGTSALRLWWAKSATAAAQELVGAGTVSVWGER